MSQYSSNSTTETNNWYVKGGNIQGSSSGKTVNIIWGKAGSGTITLIQINPSTSCSDTTYKTITINPLPVPTITGATNVLVGSTTDYTASTLTNGTNQWSVVGGAIQGASTDPQVSINWQNEGTATITLSQLSDAGCSATTTMIVTISKFIKPIIQGKLSVCQNNIETYKTITQIGSESDWTVTNGALQGKNIGDSISVLWQNVGTGKIKLVQFDNSKGWRDSIEINVTINSNPIVNLEDSVTVCTDSIYTFNPIISYGTPPWRNIQWTPVDGLNNPNILNPQFQQSSIGNYKYNLTVTDSNGCFGSDSINISVISCSNIKPTCLVYIDSAFAATGTEVSIPLILKNSNNLIQNGIEKKFTAIIRFNATLLLPNSDIDKDSIYNNDRIVDIHGGISTPSGVMKQMTYLTALGNAKCTDMIIDTVIWLNTDVDIQKENGAFCLTNVCPEGGNRLLNPNNQTAALLTIEPNPTNGEINIEYRLTEKEHSEIILLNILGETVKQIIFNEIKEFGVSTISLNLNDLSSGQYLLILKTPTIIDSKRLIIIK